MLSARWGPPHSEPCVLQKARPCVPWSSGQVKMLDWHHSLKQSRLGPEFTCDFSSYKNSRCTGNKKYYYSTVRPLVGEGQVISNHTCTATLGDTQQAEKWLTFAIKTTGTHYNKNNIRIFLRMKGVTLSHPYPYWM